MAKLLPILLAVIGIAAGGAAGFFLRPDPAEHETAHADSETCPPGDAHASDKAHQDGHGAADSHAKSDGHGKGSDHSAEHEYVRVREPVRGAGDIIRSDCVAGGSFADIGGGW